MPNLDISLASETDATTTKIAKLSALVNAVYEESEGPLWKENHARTNPTQIADYIRNEQLILARLDGEIVGCVHVAMEDGIGTFGMLVADPKRRGVGLGSKLVAAAEKHVAAKGCDSMRLELLTPQSWTLDQKNFLETWYTRIGYAIEFKSSLEEKYPGENLNLATACDFTVYRKSLEES
jgi:GNAT superfamily N-acetyltransferase